MKKSLLLAEDEDEWDRLLGMRDGSGWGWEIEGCIKEWSSKLWQFDNKSKEMAWKMQEIVEREEALAKIEKEERLSGKWNERMGDRENGPPVSEL
jgi:hypothetical protein